MKLNIPDMTCGHCKASVEQALTALDSQARIAVDLPSHMVEVETSAPQASVIAALGKIGFDARPVDA
jgi:copper chaperone